jgi:hypothetical protein
MLKMRLADDANPTLSDKQPFDIPPPDYDSDDHEPAITAEQTKGEEEIIPEKKVYSDAKPYWIDDVNAVGKGPVGSLDEKEEDFWKHLIRRYLLPIEKNPEREKRIKNELLSLRNKAVLAFFMIDILFIALLQTLQMIPKDLTTSETQLNGTSSADDSGGYYIEFKCTGLDGESKDQQIDPVGFAFLAVFGLFLVIQFFGMLFHRLFSLIQIVSSTVLCRRRSDNMSYLELTEQMTKVGGDDQSSDTQSISSTTDGLDSRRPSIQTEAGDNQLYRSTGGPADQRNVMKRLQSERKVYVTMDKIFAQRFLALNQQMNSESQDPERSNGSIQRHRPPSVITSPNRHPQRGKLARNMTHARMDIMQDIVCRRRDLFNDQRQERIKKQFMLSDKDIQGEGRRLQRLFPEVREARAFSYSSHMTDISSRTHQTGMTRLDEEE